MNRRGITYEFWRKSSARGDFGQAYKGVYLRSITRKTIKEAILNGAHTFPQVKEVTRAGTGACGGKGCGPRIVKLLAEMKEQGKI